MKYISLLFLILLPGLVFARNIADTSHDPKALQNPSMIWIKGVSFQTILAQLDSSGYKIQERYAERRIVTKPKWVKGWPVQVSLFIRHQNGITQIAGHVHNPFRKLDNHYSNDGSGLVRHDKTFGSPSFRAMNEFALSLNGIVWYEE